MTTRRHQERGALAAVWAVGLIALLLQSIAAVATTVTPPQPEARSAYAEAEAAAAEQRHADAAATYEGFMRGRGFDIETMLRAADAHVHAGDVGGATLWLERVLLVEPRHAAARERLAALRAEARVPAPADGAWTVVSRALSTTEWSLMAGSALVGLACATAVALSSSRRRRRAFIGAAVSAMALTVSSFALRTWSERDDVAIVRTDDAAARISPFAAADPAFHPLPGQLVTVSDTHGGFLRVEAADGSAGWMAQSDVAFLRPRRADR